MREIVIADNQAITNAGLVQLLEHECSVTTINMAVSKAELTRQLLRHPAAAVIVDYTLMDLTSADELLIFLTRFPETAWLLFSEDLSEDFLRRMIVCSSQVGVVLKTDPKEDIVAALRHLIDGKRFICSGVSSMLIGNRPAPSADDVAHDNLTVTERSILREIAMGKTTKEIANERNLSFHTINSHRKNIFRKLDVNNVHEATKYAIRAGIVDMAEYYI